MWRTRHVLGNDLAKGKTESLNGIHHLAWSLESRWTHMAELCRLLAVPSLFCVGIDMMYFDTLYFAVLSQSIRDFVTELERNMARVWFTPSLFDTNWFGFVCSYRRDTRRDVVNVLYLLSM
jgi:hypothetical protein